MRFNFWLTRWEVGLELRALWQIPGKTSSRYIITLCWGCLSMRGAPQATVGAGWWASDPRPLIDIALAQ